MVVALFLWRTIRTQRDRRQESEEHYRDKK